MRQEMNQEKLYELAESIKAHGILQPLVLRRKGDRFEVIAGHRRLIAAGMARLAEIPAVVRDSTDSETTVLRMHENLIREDVDPVSEAIFIVKAIKELGLDITVFARMLNRSVEYVCNRVSIAEMPSYLQRAVKDRTLPLGVALILNQVDDEMYKERWTAAAVRDGMTIRSAQNALFEWQKIRDIRADALPGEAPVPIPEVPPAYMPVCARCGQPADVRDLQIVRIHKGQCGG